MQQVNVRQTLLQLHAAEKAPPLLAQLTLRFCSFVACFLLGNTLVVRPNLIVQLALSSQPITNMAGHDHSLPAAQYIYPIYLSAAILAIP